VHKRTSALEVARRLLSEGKKATRAAETVGWSRATLYRYLKQRGAEQPAEPEQPVVLGRGRSQHAHSKPLPVRD
jgi:predicted transcriptional regulator